MDKKKITILVVILLITTLVLMMTSTKKDEIRDQDIQDYAKSYIPKRTKICLKEKHYSVDNPTEAQKKECIAIAKKRLEELIILNSNVN